MNKDTFLALLPDLIKLAIAWGPAAYNKIVTAIHKENPTLDDWRIDLATPNADAWVASHDAVTGQPIQPVPLTPAQNVTSYAPRSLTDASNQAAAHQATL